MIARIWSGRASLVRAEEYRKHYEDEVSRHLRGVPGFLQARLLSRVEGESMLFTSIAFFDGMDAVRAFAGDDYDQAVVEDAARRALSGWDEQVTHHEVAVDIRSAPGS
jgi:antibiotic biosynthesis monooxygenase (ABM) superfamily enzyme